MRVDLVNFRGAGPGAASSLLSEWRVGAILQAIAVRDSMTGQLWLDIAGQRHPARLASGDGSGPQNGEQLQLRVLRNSPVLALETLSATASPAKTADAEIVADALRKYVPRQESPALMFANLSWLAQGKNGVNTLPRAVIQAAAQLWNAIPDAAALTDPDGLETALRRSGAFLEANLASSTRGSNAANIAADLKALMFALSRTLHEHGGRATAALADTAAHSPIPTPRGPLTTLPPAPATFSLVDTPPQQLNELARQTEGALARLTTTQISNSAADASVQSMLIELPVRHEDRASILRLRIERDEASRRHHDGGDSWTIETAMDLGVVGALHAKVTLSGRRIGVQLRAESPMVVAALSTRAAELESLLRDAGLDIDRVVCLHGMPAGDAGARAARLLDVRA